METIRNYLENMFMNLPNSAEVLRAKDELLQMMEDKYAELKNEGKTENEAVGIVISEFGNLNELAEDLGIGVIVTQETVTDRKTIPKEEVKQFLRSHNRRALLVALGVFLCIVSPIGATLDLDGGRNGEVWETVADISLFIIVTIAVVLFICAGEMKKRWNDIELEMCNIDFATVQMVNEKKENQRIGSLLLLLFGIAFCILSVVPALLNDVIDSKLLESGALFLGIVAIGVFMIVYSCQRESGYNKILALNNPNTVGGNYVAAQKAQVHYNNPVVAGIMSVYWQSVTCIYLCWSFLTYDWRITWIVWLIAALVETMIKEIFKERGN